MKKNNKLILILIISYLIGFQSCEKYDYYKMSDEIKQWSAFKEGSYWIYYNDSLNIEDSIFVTSYSEYIRIDLIDDNIFYEELLYFKSSNINDSIIISYQLYPKKYGDYDFIIMEEANKYLNIRYSGIILTIPIVDEVQSYYGGGEYEKTEFIEQYSSYKISNISYNNVIYLKSSVITITLDSLKEKNKVTNEYWLAKNYGIIKKIIRNKDEAQQWELVRCNIIQ